MHISHHLAQVWNHLIAHWRLYASLISSAFALSFVVRMSRDPQYQVVGVAGVLVVVLWAMWFALRSAGLGAIMVGDMPIDVAYVSGGIMALSLLGHLWLSDPGE